MTIPSLSEFAAEIVGRGAGPLKLRIVLQPVMSAFFAIRSGLRDAREARTPFLTALLTDGPRRRDIVREGWRDVGRVFVLALVIDVVYQFAVLHAFRPLQAVFVGVVLAIVPYLLFRGLVNRLLRRLPPGAI